MKLYTEEQVKKAIELAQEMDKVPYTDNDYTHRHNEQNIIQSLAPIEIPSDEEIDKFAQIASSIRKEKSKGEWIAYKSVIAGAKWVIEQIKQQDNA